MFCPNCRKVLEDGTNFCPHCGMKTGQQNSSAANSGQPGSGFIPSQGFQPQGNMASSNQAVNVHKPVWKKAWFWIVVVIALGCIGNLMDDSESNDTSDTRQTASYDDSDEDIESADRGGSSNSGKTSSSGSGNRQSDSDPVSVSFDQLNQSPDSYIGKRIMLRGAYMEMFGYLYLTPGLISEYEYETIQLNYPSRIAYDLQGNVVGEVDGSQEGWVIGIFRGTNS